jgi:hypothetical protein
VPAGGDIRAPAAEAKRVLEEAAKGSASERDRQEAGAALEWLERSTTP